MEENTMQAAQDPTVLKLNNYAKEFLRETAKWAYFLAIMGFIGIGLIVVIALFAGVIFSAIPTDANPYGGIGGGVVTVIYLIIGGLYFFPVLYLYRFANKMKIALARNDEDVLTNAFEYLKSHYKFIGIFTIVMMSFYLLMFLIALVGGLAVAI
jgi:hypothetical protein